MADLRSYTAEEMRQKFLGALHQVSDQWAKHGTQATKKELCDSVIFSVLCVIDGVSSSFPTGLDLVCKPHEDDKQYNIDDGRNWIEDGTIINDCYLHDEWYKPSSKLNINDLGSE
jgi:hypothetical protein